MPRTRCGLFLKALPLKELALGSLSLAASLRAQRTFDAALTKLYGKAVTQLASDKLEERLGGTYTLENISKESPDDYWTVMETLSAFVRERSQRNERERTSVNPEERVAKRAYFLWEKDGRQPGKDFTKEARRLEELGEPPAADIDAVLTVIKRRNEQDRSRETVERWRFDLSKAIFKQAALRGIHLERAVLNDAHLEGAFLMDAHFEKASLGRAHFQGANLGGAHFEGAFLWGAHFERADLWNAHLEGSKKSR